MKVENQCLAAALAAFPYEGKITALEPFGSGHINDTYAVYVEGYPAPRIGYILQRLNTNVFKQPGAVMQNIMGVTEYLKTALEREQRDTSRGTLHFLKTADDQPAFYDQQGMPWRSYVFIENSFCYDKSPTVEVFYQSACAFGDFLRLLEGYPAETLHETIPYFHDTRRRLEALQQAAAQNIAGRAANCQPEIDFAMNRAEDCALLMNMLEAGELPLRVTHNDTKLNNVLFDKTTGEALCVIDLDTIMPGLSLNDYGDSIRFGATEAAEDEPDLTKVTLSLPLYEAYTKGFLQTAGPALTPTEKDMLPQGARIITLECGIRFLTDYLNGDVYFKTERPGQNLDRCRTQFKLVSDMEANFAQMQQIVKKYV
ncbi:aminoglycoside phosphotransferase family protein [Ruminococcaceae bacterium OttesenSCG-928-A16]|nr:aminoglycoside phosphotransferase family protein [Ruminococcaceae bacterium OttesenSCG-928-A16]